MGVGVAGGVGDAAVVTEAWFLPRRGYSCRPSCPRRRSAALAVHEVKVFDAQAHRGYLVGGVSGRSEEKERSH